MGNMKEQYEKNAKVYTRCPKTKKEQENEIINYPYSA
jgi:hypothetical protein